MFKDYKIVCEALQPMDVPFVVHRHNPRSGSEHFDVRFVDPRDPKILHSFAAPKNFLETANGKTVLAKTRDHDPRWLTLKSYRLETMDHGKATVKIATSKYFEVIFHGKVLNGLYKIFKMKNTFREDRWLMIKR
jgi:hypothetical protein